jgi:hypothetical protein
MVDFDQSGVNTAQDVRAYLGPSLGWVRTRVKPQRFITAPGTYNATTDDGVILVNTTMNVTINLPDVGKWMTETAYQPATAFERTIWVKDFGGHSASSPITVVPFAGQVIDTMQGSYSISTNFALVRLYPLSDRSGWLTM